MDGYTTVQHVMDEIGRLDELHAAHEAEHQAAITEHANRRPAPPLPELEADDVAG